MKVRDVQSLEVVSRELSRGERGRGDDLVGTTLAGTYRVLGKIAEGGMAAVYEVEHVRLRRRVAIKLLLRRHAHDVELIERFRREAEVLATLRHPHIVQVFDLGQSDSGDLFLVMEYLEGESLAERLEREPRLPLRSAVRIASQIGGALACMHDRNVVHRDLKPENVFLVRARGEEDFVKVLDFGISKVNGDADKLTHKNIVIGTPLYMAPEQARAERDIDARVDQFALAAMTYEMLAGASAFSGDSPVQILMQVVAAEPRPLSEIAPWVPAPVVEVVKRGLSKRKEHRFENVTEFVQTLQRAAQGIHPKPRQGPSVPPPPLQALPAVKNNAKLAVELFGQVRNCLKLDNLDDAVGYAEKLLELAIFTHDEAVYTVLGTALPILEHVFELRVGPPATRLTLTALGHNPVGLNLSDKAAFVLFCAEGGASVRDVLDACGIPRRDAIRILAGLLRRGALSSE